MGIKQYQNHWITSSTSYYVESYFSQSRGTRLPQENWCCLRLTIIIRLGLYMYICIECQSSILSHMVPELNYSFDLLQLQRLHRKIHRSRTVQIHHSLIAGSVPRSWLNASLLAQRLVAGSIFLNEKTRTNKTQKKWASYMPWSQLGVPSSSRPIHIMYSLFCFHIRSPAQRDVAGLILSSFFGVEKNGASSMPSS